jgi:hypothetical protein
MSGNKDVKRGGSGHPNWNLFPLFLKTAKERSILRDLFNGQEETNF